MVIFFVINISCPVWLFSIKPFWLKKNFIKQKNNSDKNLEN
jgi:hypothetical protein